MEFNYVTNKIKFLIHMVKDKKAEAKFITAYVFLLWGIIPWRFMIYMEANEKAK